MIPVTIFSLTILALILLNAPQLKAVGWSAIVGIVFFLVLVGITNLMAPGLNPSGGLASSPMRLLEVVREEAIRFFIIYSFTNRYGLTRKLSFAFLLGLFIAVYETSYYSGGYIDALIAGMHPFSDHPGALLSTLAVGGLWRVGFHTAICLGYALAIHRKSYRLLGPVLLIHAANNLVLVHDANNYFSGRGFDSRLSLFYTAKAILVYSAIHLSVFGPKLGMPLQIIHSLFGRPQQPHGRPHKHADRIAG